MTDIKTGEPRNVKELMQITGRSKTTIYKLAGKLGRLPTVDEVINRPNGRPKKYEVHTDEQAAQETNKSGD